MLYRRPFARTASTALVAFATAALALPLAAQQPCTGGSQEEGVVLDPNGNLIANATVLAADGQTATTDAKGHFSFACVAAASSALSVDAPGFASTTFTPVGAQLTHLSIAMAVAQVSTSISVGDGADISDALDSNHGLGTNTLRGKDLDMLADDPDDMKRELEVLSEASGGQPGAATITVDGFQNASALPPKSSIARIITAPDTYSSEYQQAPYGGGRIEIETKPGADAYHGAAFYTDSEGSFNATDPFSITATPASKRRYGFELSGPLTGKKSDFNLALEKRDINEFNVVNAIDLDSTLQQAPVQQTISAPQRLWIASARGDFQISPNDIAALSFSANVDNDGNQNIGGLTLASAGYNNHVSEYDLRLTNTQTIRPNLLQETHIGYTWKDTAQTPLSTDPSVQVAGYFLGGGSTAGHLNTRERDLEIDDDFLLTAGRHSFKIGEQAIGTFLHDENPNTFNGAYTFSGGTTATALDANDQPIAGTIVLTPLEQYRRALKGLPGGTPTTFQSTTGTALIPLAQWQLGLYVQDSVKLNSHLTVSGGLRYALQSSPGSYANLTPRFGLAWAVDKKSTTVVHARAGLFADPISTNIALEAERLNGVRQQQRLIYSPSYTDPLAPVAGSIDVATVRSLPRSMMQSPSFQAMVGVQHTFPHQWQGNLTAIHINDWDDTRSRNINAPLVGGDADASNPLLALQAPRPGTPNLNVDQYEQTGHQHGYVAIATVSQHSYKQFGFIFGYVHMNVSSDVVSGAGFAQSAYSNAGENSRPNWQNTDQFFGFGNLNLPKKVTLTAEFDANTGKPYNVITGNDNNGDGQFNDRPSFASAPGADVYSTRFGLMTPDVVNGNVPRNLGTMPSLVHLDMNLERVWKLGGKKSTTARSLTLNARSANILNHTNVTAVSNVVSSPTFSQSVAAEAARRLEVGARFTF